MKNTVIVFLFSAVLLSCASNKPKFKMAYVNLQEVYAAMPALLQADSLHKVQMQRLDAYITSVNKKLETEKADAKYLELATKAYNDTVLLFKNQTDKALEAEFAKANNSIQHVIDSVGKANGWDYVLSTKNQNLLYVNDSTNNITPLIKKLVKE